MKKAFCRSVDFESWCDGIQGFMLADDGRKAPCHAAAQVEGEQKLLLLCDKVSDRRRGPFFVAVLRNYRT